MWVNHVKRVDADGQRTPSHLCDGKVKADIDDDSEEENVKGRDDQQRLLQHQDLIEVIMNLATKGNKFIISLDTNLFSQFSVSH